MSVVELEVQPEPAVDPSQVRRWKRYPAYRDSGVEWLGEVPAHWTTMRFKYAASSIQMGPFGGMLKDLSPMDTGFKVYGQENTINNDFEVGHRWITQTQYLDLSRYSLVPGDLVLTRKGSIGKCKVFPTGVQPGIADSDTIRVRLDGDTVLTPFVVRLLHDAQYLQEQIRYSSRGAILSGLSTTTIAELYLTLPPLPEQRIIAAFMDRETARIDALVAKKERLIGLLQEKRTALISHAVTKGLNPDVPVRNTGVEWLGKVPAHWEMKKLKHVISFVTSGSRGWAEHYTDEGPIFLRIGNLSRGTIALDLQDIQHVVPPLGTEGQRTRTRGGDVLFSITAYIGSVGLVPQEFGDAYVSQHVALTRPIRSLVEPEWIGFTFISHPGQALLRLPLYGGTKEGLSLDDVRDLPLLLPPLEEQRQIVQYLVQQTSRYGRLIEKLRQHIASLHEYRTALISAAVTGKIDVRDEVAT